MSLPKIDEIDCTRRSASYSLRTENYILQWEGASRKTGVSIDLGEAIAGLEESSCQDGVNVFLAGGR